MAVLGMKLLIVVGLSDSLDGVVRSCLVGRDFQPENPAKYISKFDDLQTFNYENPYSDLFKKALTISENMGIELNYRDFKSNKSENSALRGISDYFDGLNDRLSVLIKERDSLLKLVSENENVLVQLSHFGNAEVRLEELNKFNFIVFRFGRISIETYENMKKFIYDSDDYYFFKSTTEGDYVYGMYVAPKLLAEKAEAAFNTLHFEPIELSKKASGTPDEAKAQLEVELKNARQRLSEIELKLEEIRHAEGDRYLTDYSYVRFLNDTYDIRRYAAHTNKSFYIFGWIPETRADEVKSLLDSVPEIAYSFDDPQAIPELTPPIKLKNKKFFLPFEDFVSMYGLPAYNELDPTALLAITYTLLFGIMFGDIGHGLCLLAAGILLWKLKKISLGRVLAYCGTSATVFGIIYGSIFGKEDLLPGFKVLESSQNTNFILLAGIGLGVFLIIFAMFLNIVNGIRQKDVEKVFFSHNGVAGIVLYVAVILISVALLMGKSNYITTPLIVLMIFLPLGIIFIKDPLTKLINKRKDWVPKNKGEFIIENFIELFDVLLSYLTNTISFVRVGAFALNHAAMMMVVYILARSFGNSDNIAVIIIGNIFVMGLEGLIVGIQVMRLEFYELFSRFYSGNGIPHAPFEIDYKNNN